MIQPEELALIKTLREIGQEFNFSTILSHFRYEHYFKYKFDSVMKLSKCAELYSFSASCYTFAFFKFISLDKENNLIPNSLPLLAYASELSDMIKEQYFQLLQKIQTRKSETMEFILFLLFFSVPLAIEFTLLNQKIPKAFSFALRKQFCLWINKLITGMQIHTSLYKYLIKKYYYKPKFQNLQMVGVSNLALTQKTITQFKFRRDIQSNVHHKVLDLHKELKSIFYNKNIHNKPKSNNDKPEPEPAKTQQKILQPKFSHYNSMRNSNAFTQKRKSICETDLKIKKMCQTTCGFSRKNKKVTKRSIKQINNASGAMISKTIMFMMQKQLSRNKKFVFCQPKPKIEDWGKRLQKIQSEGNFQIISLANTNRNPRIKIKSSAGDEDDNFVKYIRNRSCEQMGKKCLLIQKIRESQDNRKTGFCEFIDNFEYHQLGIVKKITGNEPANIANIRINHQSIKSTPRGLKQQFEQFNQKSSQYEQKFHNEQNEPFKIQKLISRAVKI